MTMCVDFLDGKKRALAEIRNAACFATIESKKFPDEQFFRFYLPRKEEIAPPKLYEGYSGDDRTLFSDKERVQWISLIGELYNFKEHYHEVSDIGAWVDFDLKKTPGFYIFAVGTLLRYAMEHYEIASGILKLSKKIPVKEAIVFGHYQKEVNQGHGFFQNIYRQDPEILLKRVPLKPILKSGYRFRTDSLLRVYNVECIWKSNYREVALKMCNQLLKEKKSNGKKVGAS